MFTPCWDQFVRFFVDHVLDFAFYFVWKIAIVWHKEIIQFLFTVYVWIFGEKISFKKDLSIFEIFDFFIYGSINDLLCF